MPTGKPSKSKTKTSGKPAPSARKKGRQKKKRSTAEAAKKSKKPLPPPYDSSNLNNPLPVRHKLFCCYAGEFYEVQILERKQVSPTPADNPPLNSAQGERAATLDLSTAYRVLDPSYDLKAHPYVYYVHYLPWDRRMDEWVTRDRLRLKEEKAVFEAVRHRSPTELQGEEKKTEAHHGMSEEDMRHHEEATKVKNIDAIQFGRHKIQSWYFSPFPEMYNRYPTLYFCEFCLAFFGHKLEHKRHMTLCKARHPPGNEIYRSQETNVTIIVFEVDGWRETVYCQNLCYIAKLFLDHKTLEYDCTPFLFYVLCELDEHGAHMVGYFSKEKKSYANYNLACILTLPCHQGKGYGKFLISLSYELSKIEKKPGSPEKPISDLGKVSYLSYWSSVILDIIESKQEGEQLSLDQISKMSMFVMPDIIETLQYLKILVWYNGKWVFSLDNMKIALAKRQAKKERLARLIRPDQIRVAPCRPELLHWTPFRVRKRQRI